MNKLFWVLPLGMVLAAASIESKSPSSTLPIGTTGTDLTLTPGPLAVGASGMSTDAGVVSTGPSGGISFAATMGGRFCFDLPCTIDAIGVGTTTFVKIKGGLTVGGTSDSFQVRRNTTAWLIADPATLKLSLTGITAKFSSEATSGNNGVEVTTNGSRIDFGAGASDYASSNGTTVTFAGPISSTSITSSVAFILPATDGGSAEKVAVLRGNISAQQAEEFAQGTLVANALAITFNTPFATAPTYCGCSHISAVPIACGPTAAASTTGVTFAVPAGTGDIYWRCIGAR